MPQLTSDSCATQSLRRHILPAPENFAYRRTGTRSRDSLQRTDWADRSDPLAAVVDKHHHDGRDKRECRDDLRVEHKLSGSFLSLAPEQWPRPTTHAFLDQANCQAFAK